MWEDPVVAEIQKIREELCAKFNYDVAAVFADMRSREAEPIHANAVEPELYNTSADEPVWEDPIVAEVHKVREALAAKFNYDVGAMFADMRAREKNAGRKSVSRKRRARTASPAKSKRAPVKK